MGGALVKGLLAGLNWSCGVLDGALQESMDELTVKDTLEGDNMYTCSQCGRKVRAEKR